MNYRIQGKIKDNGFMIDEIMTSRADANTVCEEVGLNPATAITLTDYVTYLCEYCGIYNALSPKCNKCECIT